MVGNPIIVKMIESTIDRAIRDIRVNPENGLISLVELANRFANNPVQKDLVETLQAMLRDPNNPYHKIIPALVNHVHPHTIKTFIINVGYNSLSYGGKKIRQYKKIYNDSIPWTIVFDSTEEPDGKLDNDVIISAIEKGKRNGIYTYVFFTDNINEFSYILRRNPDCAFILYVAPMILTSQNILDIKSYHNTFFSVLYEPTMNVEIFKHATKLLYDYQCLFGSHSYYSNENIEYILSNQWVNEIIRSKSPFGFLIESQNCSPKNVELIHDYIGNSRINPEYPAFLIDLYEDIAKIDEQFSKV